MVVAVSLGGGQARGGAGVRWPQEGRDWPSVKGEMLGSTEDCPARKGGMENVGTRWGWTVQGCTPEGLPLLHLRF